MAGKSRNKTFECIAGYRKIGFTVSVQEADNGMSVTILEPDGSPFAICSMPYAVWVEVNNFVMRCWVERGN